MSGTDALIGRDTEMIALSAMRGYRGGRLQNGAFTKGPTMLVLSLDLNPPELWDINVSCLSHPVYGIFFFIAAQLD